MSAEFTKTLIVDCDLSSPTPPYYNNIKDAVNDLSSLGGVVIVEEGT